MMSVDIALVIQNCPAGKFQRNLDRTLAVSEAAAHKGADVVVFPELNLTGYLTGSRIPRISRKTDDRALSRITRLCEQYGITVMAGLAEQTASGNIYATHLVFRPDGPVARYRKIHTAPFEKETFSSGSDIAIFHIAGFCFGIQLCYDAHFPELSCAMALKGVDAILIPHASPRGTCEEKYTSWLRHLTARAFDNGIYVAACNQTGDNAAGLTFPGISLLVGPDGHVIDQRTDGRQGIHLVRIDRDTLDRIRSHKMRYFLPNRRNDLFKLQ